MEAERGYLDEVGNWIPEQGLSSAPLASPSELVLRSQITPEVRVSLTDMAQPQEQEPPGVVNKAIHWFLSNIVRPEVEITMFGAPQRIAPWGRPKGNHANLLAVGTLATLAGAAYLGYRFCGRKS